MSYFQKIDSRSKHKNIKKISIELFIKLQAIKVRIR